MNKITLKGRKTMDVIYEAIVKFTVENLYPPSIPEIKAMTNIKSTSTIQTNLVRLAQEEKIELGGGNRCIKLNGYKLTQIDNKE